MKARNFFSALASSLLVVATTLTSCSINDGEGEYMSEESGKFAYSGLYDPSDPNGNGTVNGNTQAGIVTAGEWCDLTHWSFWSKLMLGEDYAEKSDYWKFYTNNRVAVKVTDASGNAVAGVPVTLKRGKATLWEAVTDNHGLAECWVGLIQKETADASNLNIAIDGQLMDGHPTLCQWDSLGQSTINEYVYTGASKVKQQADIAFIVDATGSMSDEINFLKNDLDDIIVKVASVRPDISMRTAALFYRDEGDDYLTRHSDFTTQLSDTQKFVSEQNADGGGDYPEAVHTALEHMLKNLSWDNNARTRIAFMILDAPAHYENGIINSLQQSIQLCASRGIRLIPVAASGVDKNTEFMLRFFAIATGGTYVFLTNDSGVGLDHITPTVGEYEVEQLNNLLIRLIDYYTE